jgi:cell division transport system permease protein
MAVSLIALALYVPGLLGLLAKNLARLVVATGERPAAVLTLDPAADARALAYRAAADPRVARVVIVGSAAALERFRIAYPELGAAIAELREAPFPPSLEIFLRPGSAGSGAAFATAARSWPGVETAESEEEFHRRFHDAVRLLRGAALFLGGILTLAAVLTVASAVRLALDLHRDEIEIMRLMGATETAVRAPFWLNAAAEGLLGGAIALALLYASYRFAAQALSRQPHPVLSLFWSRFLDWPASALLPFAGTAAGFLGSVLSLGRRT